MNNIKLQEISKYTNNINIVSKLLNERYSVINDVIKILEQTVDYTEESRETIIDLFLTCKNDPFKDVFLKFDYKKVRSEEEYINLLTIYAKKNIPYGFLFGKNILKYLSFSDQFKLIFEYCEHPESEFDIFNYLADEEMLQKRSVSDFIKLLEIHRKLPITEVGQLIFSRDLLEYRTASEIEELIDIYSETKNKIEALMKNKVFELITNKNLLKKDFEEQKRLINLFLENYTKYPINAFVERICESPSAILNLFLANYNMKESVIKEVNLYNENIYKCRIDDRIDIINKYYDEFVKKIVEKSDGNNLTIVARKKDVIGILSSEKIQERLSINELFDIVNLYIDSNFDENIISLAENINRYDNYEELKHCIEKYKNNVNQSKLSEITKDMKNVKELIKFISDNNMNEFNEDTLILKKAIINKE